jgi:hypothetical protein
MNYFFETKSFLHLPNNQDFHLNGLQLELIHLLTYKLNVLIIIYIYVPKINVYIILF